VGHHNLREGNNNPLVESGKEIFRVGFVPPRRATRENKGLKRGKGIWRTSDPRDLAAWRSGRSAGNLIGDMCQCTAETLRR